MPVDIADYSYETLLDMLEPLTNTNDPSKTPTPTSSKLLKEIWPNGNVYALDKEADTVYFKDFQKGEKKPVTPETYKGILETIMSDKSYLRLKNPDRFISAKKVFELAMEALTNLTAHIQDDSLLPIVLAQIIANYFLEKEHISKAKSDILTFFKSESQTPSETKQLMSKREQPRPPVAPRRNQAPF